MPGQRVNVVDVDIAWVHDSHDVSAGWRYGKVTDAVFKSSDVKQLCKRADVNKPDYAILT